MQKIDFNESWRYRRIGGGEWTDVRLPHDAQICEPRSPGSDGGVNTGWFEAFDYEYEKDFFVPAEYADKALTIEFEGVYRNAEVYINGKKAAYRPYGYTNFYVPINEYAVYGATNSVRVIARNADQPNSRWYSGAGIYRPASLFVAPQRHILINGVKIRTLSIGDPSLVEVVVKTNASGEARIRIFDGDDTIAEGVASVGTEGGKCVLEIRAAKLWSPDDPALYTCRVDFCDDATSERFGIRTVSVTAENGFCLNGERVILRGACIHSDNGILGACGYREADERKIALLKRYGYNAVRSAHNPCSKAMLDACDRLGMMVMDEYVDMWYIHKNMYDYADYVEEWYERDLTDMIDKDHNHPCVVMYSLGNEVAETAQARGIEFFKRMYGVCKALDDRPVTTGVNIFFNLLHSMGLGVYSDKKANKNPTKKVGSEFFNELAGKLGAAFMKTMACLPACDKKTRDCYAAMDIAGYNYGIKRYRRDTKKYPQRIILGSETFCSDAYAFWRLAHEHKAVIGDFVWAGMDYLGEVGVGSWEYKQYAPSFKHGVGWIAAGSGRIDLIGDPLGEALYTMVAFDLTDSPQLAVVPVNHTKEKHSPSAWKFSNAIPSWSWEGLDGRPAVVEVYSKAPIVELYVNDRRVGRKRFKKNCRFVFKTKYRGGTLKAVALGKDGEVISSNILKTAGKQTRLSVLPEKATVSRGEVCFVRLAFTDDDGCFKPLYRERVKVEVEGGELLALGNGCPFNADGYCGDSTLTYYGRALAVVRATGDVVTVKASSGELNGSAIINAE